MRLLPLLGCRNRRDLAACAACYAVLLGLFFLMCWPAAWS